MLTVHSKRRLFSTMECVSAVQGHPRSMILVPIESAYATPTSYKSVIVTFVLSCIFSEIRRLIGRKVQIFLPLFYSAPPLPRFLLDVRDDVNREETIESWGYLSVKTARDRQTDRQTDRRIYYS